MPAGDATYLVDQANIADGAQTAVFMGVPHTQHLLLRVTAGASVSGGTVEIKMADSEAELSTAPATPEIGGEVITFVAGKTLLLPFWYSRPYLQATIASAAGTTAAQVAIVLGRKPNPEAADD